MLIPNRGGEIPLTRKSLVSLAILSSVLQLDSSFSIALCGHIVIWPLAGFPFLYVGFTSLVALLAQCEFRGKEILLGV